MSKGLKWTLIIGGTLAAVFIISKIMGGGKKDIKVSTEKVTQRTIVESVNASGKIYPELEVTIFPEKLLNLMLTKVIV